MEVDGPASKRRDQALSKKDVFNEFRDMARLLFSVSGEHVQLSVKRRFEREAFHVAAV
jgi:hypothetical protein